jgi:hypothetical protein
MSERQAACFVRKIQLVTQDAGDILNVVADWRVLGSVLHTAMRRRAFFVRELQRHHQYVYINTSLVNTLNRTAAGSEQKE